MRRTLPALALAAAVALLLAAARSADDQPSSEKPKPGEETLRWNWDSPFLISPHDPKRLYFASNRVFRTDGRGNAQHLEARRIHAVVIGEEDAH